MTELLSAAGRGLLMAFLMFWETLWPLVLGFALSGAVQAFVSRSQMQRLLGDHRPRTLAIAGFFGVVSSSCSYAASAMAKSLFQKGADFRAAVTFMLASTNLVIELGLVIWVLMGWRFALAEYVGGIVMIGLFAVLAGVLLRADLVERARERLSAGEMGHHHDHGEPAGTDGAWSRRVRSLSGWADAAGYMFADLNMVRRELVIGYLVAGFLAVLVPAGVWRFVFFSGHGAATSVENVVVGPAIAIVSFVCSIGNVPLAAALWAGGISFGGVVSFIFGDLITFPLLLIYRRLYGWALTLRLAAVLWLVMALAGLVVEGIFSALGLIPAGRAIAVPEPRLVLDYTAVLNIVAIGVLLGLFWLHRNHDRFRVSDRYAIDPVCGMQVDKSLAPAQAIVDGTQHWFCSDHCRERFLRGHARGHQHAVHES